MSLPSSFNWCRERMDRTTTDLLGLDHGRAQVVQLECEVIDRRDIRACFAERDDLREPCDEPLETEHGSLDPGVQLQSRDLEPISPRARSREPRHDAGLIGEAP